MQEYVGEVESPRMGWRGPEKRDVGHIGYPQERHIHWRGGIGGRKSGANALRREAVPHEGVVDDIGGVVRLDQFVAERWSEQGKDQHKQQESRKNHPKR